MNLVSIRLPTRSSRPGLEDLERHILRCRRREEPASILAARVDRWNAQAEAGVRGCFRLTDSVAVRRIGWTLDVLGVFDEHRLDRRGVERRLRDAAAGAELRIAWASFPREGVTLGVLLDTARARRRAGSEPEGDWCAETATARS